MTKHIVVLEVDVPNNPGAGAMTDPQHWKWQECINHDYPVEEHAKVKVVGSAPKLPDTTTFR